MEKGKEPGAGSWSGRRIGHYEIGESLGAGGMGQVYKARDTRLDRTVAIKFLAEHISNDPDARQRFEREAKTIASLNHPNICVLYDIGQHEGIDYLVMEYLEGVTLADCLAKGPLPLSESIKIGTQVGDALDKAHQNGVVHRDLKPGNIMLTENGAKLLDFGLAKVVNQPKPPAVQGSIAPTAVDDLTRAGAIVGTIQYMAPEQIDGAEADARSDIFAFGTVLYEMITGKKAFQGKSQALLISAIVSTEPAPLSQVRSGLPPILDHVISRCLSKDPAERWHSVRDVLLELKWAAETQTPAATKTEAPARSSKWLAIGVIALAVAVVIAGLIYLQTRPGERLSAADVRFEIPVVGMPGPFNLAVSPDGRKIVYVVAANGVLSLWVRPINSLNAQMLAGTEGARFADWSADGQSIVFATTDQLKRVDAAGGNIQTLTSLTGNEYRRSAWNRNGVVLFANTVIRQVPAAGGPAVAITELDKSLDEVYHATPWFLPDGRHFLYQTGSTKPENRAIYVGSLDSKDRKRLMTSESKAIYSPPGFILYRQDKSLMARPFDANGLEFTGEAVPVASDIAYDQGLAAFYASAEGTLIYRTAEAMVARRQWYWADRSGKASSPIGTSLLSQHVRLSPDGKRFAFFEADNNMGPDIFIQDIERNLKTRLTTSPGPDVFPVWSPDGTRLAFSSSRDVLPVFGIYERVSNAAVAEQLLLAPESGMRIAPDDWSQDGQRIVFEKAKVDANRTDPRDLWILPMAGDRKPVPYLANGFDKAQAAISPNGRWLAYTSNEPGSYQVFVQPFPNASEGKWQVSTQGGIAPRWRRDGRELYYIDPNRRVVAVSVTTDTKFEVGKSEPLFETPQAYPQIPGVTTYDVNPDGQRFLISAPLPPASAQITVILNWPYILRKK